MSNSDARTHEAPKSIPLPPDFPVTWEQPEDERLFWTRDIMHFPEQMKPMTTLFAEAFNKGFANASQVTQMPIRLRYSRLNTHMYAAMVPMVPPEEMEAQGKRAEETLKGNIARLTDWWEGELLPEVKNHLAFWEDFDLAEASMADLLAHLDETESRFSRLWDIHFLVAFPFLVGPSLFSELYEDLFGTGEGRALNPFRLAQGFGNKTVEGDHALWDLSRKALASPPVHAVLEGSDVGDVPTALEGSPEGRSFLDEFRAYLDEYGQRSDIFADASDPHWIEDPATPIKVLKDHIAAPDRDLRAELAELAAERERHVAEAREYLAGYPQAVVEQFEFLLKAAQVGTIIQEDHNYWIDQRATYKLRQVLLEFGHRFAREDAIERPEDIFYLAPQELRDSASRLSGADHREIVAERKVEMDRFRALKAPNAVGTEHPGPPPDDPVGRAFGRFFGAPPEVSDDPKLLNGNPASAGKVQVQGTARVVLSLTDAGKLKPGDVMVAPATMPAWTPLFASIAAVVTDVGGVLSHAAIVAREYGIPAVLGTLKATSVLQDGQSLEVDGDAGTVRILDSS